MNSEDDFFSLVDSRLAEYADDATAFVREDRELAGAHADCMRPVEAVREPPREKLREQSVSENTREIAALRSKLGFGTGRGGAGEAPRGPHFLPHSLKSP